MTMTPDIARPDSRRWWALAALTLAVLAVGLDLTVLSVALPTLASALHASESQLQWFSASYALALAAAMLPAGVFGDRFGRKRIMLGSLVLFGIGSLGCAYATDAGLFTVARVLLGVAGAGVAVTALSVVTVMFPVAERQRAIGVWASANFLAMPIGPILGGWMLTHLWWGTVFLMNVPVVLIGIVAVIALIPESRADVPPALDPFGMALSAGGLAAVVYGFIEAGQNGWGDLGALLWIVGGLALLFGFWLWERSRARHPGRMPLVDFALFASPAFTWGVALAALGVLTMVGVMFTLPQYFQAVRGFDAMGSGLSLLPLILGLVIGAIGSARIAKAIGAKLTTAAGFAIMAVGLVLGSTASVHTGTTFILAWMAVFGLGIGIALTNAASAAMAVLPADRAGVGSAVMGAMQKLGAPLGAAIIGSVVGAVYVTGLATTTLTGATASAVRSSVFAGVSVAGSLHSPELLATVTESFTRAMDVALLVSAGLAAVGMLLALIFIPRAAAEVSSVEQEGAERVDRGDARRRTA